MSEQTGEPGVVRVAVSGVGVVSALGPTAVEFRDALFSGRHGIGPIDAIDVSHFDARVGGQVRDEWFLDRLDDWERCELGRDAQLAVASAAEAIAASGLVGAGYDPARIAVVVGRCQGDVGRLERGRPLQAAADAIARRLAAGGPRVVIATACAASTNAIGLGLDLVQSGDVDVAIVGGADDLRQSTYAGFASLQSLSPVRCEPYGRSDGLNLGEGAGFLVLERADSLEGRGRESMALVLGYGLSADAYHPTAPDPTGRGAVSAITRALEDAGVAADDLDYVNGHGTGTPTNDRMERKAMRALFSKRDRPIPMSSTKSYVGHTLGASGAIEAIACVMALQDGVLPPSGVADDSTGEAAEDVEVVDAPRPAPLRLVATSNYAFGGNNAALVLGRGDLPPVHRSTGPTDRRVVITGIGAVGAVGLGRAAWGEALLASSHQFGSLDLAPVDGVTPFGAPMPALSADGIAPPRLWRQMDGFSRQALTAAQLAVRDAGYRPTRTSAERTGVFLATGTGPGRVGLAFDRSAAADPTRPDVLSFPNTTINAASGHICTCLGVRGPTTTISTGHVSGLVALEYAADTIRRGRADAVIVVACDELNDALFRDSVREGVIGGGLPAPFDRHRDGTALGEAAVAVLVEDEATALARGAEPALEVLAAASASSTCGLYEFDPSGAGLASAIDLALARARIGAEALAACSSSATGVTVSDEAEAKVLSGRLPAGTPITAPKSVIGESWASAALAAVVVADLVAHRQLVPPIASLDTPVDDQLGFVVGAPAPVAAGPVLLTANALGGTASAVVVGPYSEMSSRGGGNS